VSQIDGEPAWHGKTYNALKDKKHLTGINKEEVLKIPFRSDPLPCPNEFGIYS
jgi:hypothetical protein